MVDLSNAALVAAIRADALAAYPEESCGLVKNGRYIQCDNVAADPENGFRITQQQWETAPDAVVHSHPDGPDCPSRADMEGQIATALPWVIVSTNGGDCLPPFVFGSGVPVQPLKGRGFRHGVTDCYALIRDYYALERRVALPEFPRDWEWWLSGDPEFGDLYRTGFAKAGFEMLPDGAVPMPGDVFLAQTPDRRRTPRRVPSHGGIYIGNGEVLHHLTGDKAADASRLSTTDPVSRWQSYITHWLRYTEK